MTFSQAVRTCFAKYKDFSGTATRSEYWYFQLFLFVCVIGALLFIGWRNSPMMGLWLVLALLAMVLPSLAVSARRLRDGGFSPWLLVLHFVPYVGSFVLFVLFCMPSTTGSGRRGNVPRVGGSSPAFCGVCGTALRPGQSFCQSCGSPV